MRRIVHIIHLVLMGILVPIGASAFEQGPPVSEEEHIKTENIETIIVNANRPMSDIGIQKTVFDEESLREDVTFSLADMLTQSSPVFIKSHGRGTMATASFRGTGSSHTRVTWNGMRMNSPLFGMMDLSYIPSYFIDGAALYHGASSVGVAGGGLGGAIALDTKPLDERGFGLKFVQGAASFGTFDEYLKLSYGGEKFKSETSVLYTASRNDFKYTNYAKKDFVLDDKGNVTGWSYPQERNSNCGYYDLHILQELYYDAGSKGVFGLSGWYMDSSRGIPLLNTDYSESKSSGSFQDERTFRGVLRWDMFKGNNKFSAKAGYHYSDMRYLEESMQYYEGGAPPQKQTRSDWRSYINTVFGNFSWERSFGRKLYLQTDLTMLQHFVYTRNDQPVRVYGQPTAYDDARLELSGLVSVRYAPVSSVGVALNMRQEVIGDEGAPFIPALLLDWRPADNDIVTLKASVARNYRFPTVNDRHFAKGTLLPESGLTYDAGIDVGCAFRNTEYRASLTFYDSYISNWIFWYPDKGATQWLPTNIKLVHSYGAEAAAGAVYGFPAGVELGIDGIAAWTRSVNRRDPISENDNAVGKQLPYVPVWSGSLTARAAWKGWSLRYHWNYYSERFTTTDNSALISGRIVPYFMNDISLSKIVEFRWGVVNFSFKVNNLFNEEYETELSRPMPGRNYGVSIAVTPLFKRR